MFFLHFQSSAVWNSRSSRKLEEWLADWPLTLDGLLLSKGSELHPNRPCRQNISRLSTNHQVERLERSGPRKEMSPMAQILALIWSWFWYDLIWSWFWHMQSSFLFFFLILFADFNLVVSVSQIFSNFLKSSCLLHRPLVGFPKVTASHIDLGASGKGHMKCEEYDRNMSLKKIKTWKINRRCSTFTSFMSFWAWPCMAQQVEVDTVVEYFWPYRCVTAAWPQKHHQAARSFWASSPHTQGVWKVE